MRAWSVRFYSAEFGGFGLSARWVIRMLLWRVEAVLVDHIEERTGDGLRLRYSIRCVKSHPIFWRRILCLGDTSYQKEKFLPRLMIIQPTRLFPWHALLPLWAFFVFLAASYSASQVETDVTIIVKRSGRGHLQVAPFFLAHAWIAGEMRIKYMLQPVI